MDVHIIATKGETTDEFDSTIPLGNYGECANALRERFLFDRVIIVSQESELLWDTNDHPDGATWRRVH